MCCILMSKAIKFIKLNLLLKHEIAFSFLVITNLFIVCFLNQQTEAKFSTGVFVNLAACFSVNNIANILNVLAKKGALNSMEFFTP